MEFENRFYKIGQHGGTYVVAELWNPVTKEHSSKCVRDYDYDDCSRDDDDLYYAPIDEDAKRDCLHFNGVILEGDDAEVVKGRTIEHGFVGKVMKVKELKDRYGRWIADYIYFEDGRKINMDNCRLVKEDV